MEAIITGGSSGLGLEIAKQLIERNIDVILIGRSREKLKNASTILHGIRNEAKIEYYDFDISNEKSVVEFFELLGKRGDRIDYLFNVAGKFFYGKIEEITYEDIMNTLKANMVGLMLMTSHGVAHMKSFSASKQRIISILSTAALKGKKFESVYNASKWGARGFLEAVREEAAGSGIEIINIYPGGMKTPFWEGSNSGYAVDTFMNPEDVAGQIVAVAVDHKIYVSDVTINRSK